MFWSSSEERNAGNICQENEESSLLALDLIECPELDLYSSTPTKSRSKKRNRQKSKNRHYQENLYMHRPLAEVFGSSFEGKKSQTKNRSFDRKIKFDTSSSFDSPSSPDTNGKANSQAVSTSENSNNHFLNSNIYKNINSPTTKTTILHGNNAPSSIPHSNTGILTSRPFKCLVSHPITIAASIFDAAYHKNTAEKSSLPHQDNNNNDVTNFKDKANDTTTSRKIYIESLNYHSPISRSHSLKNNNKTDNGTKSWKQVRNEREEFCQKFSMLIEPGKGRESWRQQYGKQLSVEESLWRSEWSDVLWLELQAWINAVPACRQDAMLDLQRTSVPAVLKKIKNFKVQKKRLSVMSFCCPHNASYLDTPTSNVFPAETPTHLITPSQDSASIGPYTSPFSSISHTSFPPNLSSSTTSHYQTSSPNCVDIIGACINNELSSFIQAARQASVVINQIEWLQSLYPNEKALIRDQPEYSEAGLQARLTCLHLWYDTTFELVRYIKYVYDLVVAVQLKAAEQTKEFSLWRCVDVSQLDRLLQVLKHRHPERLKHLISKQSSKLSNESASTLSNFDITDCLSRMDERSDSEDRDFGGGECDVDCEVINNTQSSAHNDSNHGNQLNSSSHSNHLNSSNPAKTPTRMLSSLTSKSSMLSLDSYDVSAHSFYRKFIDRSLKTSEVRELYTRLKRLLQRCLNRSRNVLQLLDADAAAAAAAGHDDEDEERENGAAKFVVSLANSSGHITQDLSALGLVAREEWGSETLGSGETVVGVGGFLSMQTSNEREGEKEEGDEKGKEKKRAKEKVEAGSGVVEEGGGKMDGEDGGMSGAMKGDLKRCMAEMQLPSFKSFFLFLAKVLLDVTHEGLKLRLAQQSSNNPCIESLKPLIKQCKEMLRVSVSMKAYYLELTGGVRCGGGHEGEMDKFEESLMQMLKLYFDYMNQFTSHLQQALPMSIQLKDFMEREWRFCKEVCCHIHNGEAGAGNKFCSMTSSLLKYTSDILNANIDECISKLNHCEERSHDEEEEDDEEEEEEDADENAAGDDDDAASTRGLRKSNSVSFRRRLLALGSELKKHFNEAKASSLSSVAFAKMIKNDLEVASEYEVVVPVSQLLQDLKITNHVELLTGQQHDYVIFAPNKVASDHNLACHLLNVACCSDEHFDDDHGFQNNNNNNNIFSDNNDDKNINNMFSNNNINNIFSNKNNNNINNHNNDNSIFSENNNNILSNNNNYNRFNNNIKNLIFNNNESYYNNNNLYNNINNNNSNNNKISHNSRHNFIDRSDRPAHNSDSAVNGSSKKNRVSTFGAARPRTQEHLVDGIGGRGEGGLEGGKDGRVQGIEDGRFEGVRDEGLEEGEGEVLEKVNRECEQTGSYKTTTVDGVNTGTEKNEEEEDEEEDEDEEGRKNSGPRIRFSSQSSFSGVVERHRDSFSEVAFQSLNIDSRPCTMMYNNYLIFVNKNKLTLPSGEALKWDGLQLKINPNAEATIALVHVEVERLVLVALHSSKLHLCRKTLEECLRGDVRLLHKQMSCHQIIVESLNELKTSAIDFQDNLHTSLHSITRRFDSVDLAGQALEASKVARDSKDLINYGYSFGFEYHKELYRLITGGKRGEVNRRMVQFALQWMLFAQSYSKGHGVKPRWAHQGFDFLRFLMDTNNTDLVMGLPEHQFQDWKVNFNKCIAHVVGIKQSTSSHLLHAPSSMSPTRCATPTRSLSSTPSLVSSTVFKPRVQAWRKAVESLDSGLDRARLMSKQIGQVTRRSDNSYNSVLKARKVKFKWLRGKMIGKGQFGMVFSVVNLNTGELLAMKQMKLPLNDSKRMKKIEYEVRILESLSHPSLVQFHGAEVFSDELLIFTELCQQGTLEDLSKQRLSETLVRSYSHSILNAIYVLHSHYIVHRDIKGSNIFVMPDHSIKLGDFGYSVQLNAQDTLPGELNDWVGTPAFMAPEVINSDPEVGYGRAADIWSFGCVIIQMFTGKRPWPKLDKHEQIIFKVGSCEIPDTPDYTSQEAQEFLGYCLQADPKMRWSAEQLLEHTFVKVDIDEENDLL